MRAITLRFFSLLVLGVGSARALSSRAGSVRSLHKLPRLYIDQDLGEGKQVTLTGDEAHYVGTVMRVKPGFCFRGFNARSGQGEYLFEISESKIGRSSSNESRGEIKAEVKSLLRSFDEEEEARKGRDVTLYFAPVKKQKVKLMMEKATELGLGQFVPVLSQNVNVDIDFEKDGSFDRVILESAEQCERMDIPVLQKVPLSLSSLITEWEGRAKGSLLVCRERSSSSDPLLSTLLAGSGASAPLGLLVGPEGGFTDFEFEEMEKSPSVRFVSLGSNVLRAETAAIAAMAMVSAALDYRGKEK